jgi:hypothetical protein
MLRTRRTSVSLLVNFGWLTLTRRAYRVAEVFERQFVGFHNLDHAVTPDRRVTL